MSEKVTYENGILTTTVQNLETFELIADCTQIYGKTNSDYAFYNCKDTLVSFTVQDGSKLEQIGNYAFYRCSKLVSADLHKCTKLINIWDHAFQSCSSLKSVIFQSTQLVTVNFPESLKTIWGNGFRDIKTLETVNFGENPNITIFYDSLFRSSTIKSITIPRSVKEIRSNSLENTKNLMSIDVQEGNEYFFSVDHVLYDAKNLSLIRFPIAKVNDTFYIPDNITSIGSVSADNANIKRIQFSPNFTSFGNYSLQFSKIEEVKLPDTVTELGVHTFYGCKFLKTVVLSKSLTSLPEGCFYKTAIEEIIIPKNITSIDNNCFQSCSSLGLVQLPSNISYLGGGVFSSCPNIDLTFDNSSDLFIDSQYLLMNKNQSRASQYLGNSQAVIIPETVEIIQSSCFLDNSKLTSVIFSSFTTLIKIEINAFAHCILLSDISLPTSLEYIGEGAFYNCKQITSLNFSQNLTFIDKNAFRYCSGLTNIVFDDTTNKLTIKDNVFMNCPSLERVKLPEGLTSIGLGCFSESGKLREINIPASLENIGQESFNQTSLTSVSMHSSGKLQKISSKLFYKCFNLSSITLCPSIVEIEAEAFAYTALTTIEIPFNVSYIGNKCFSNCKSLSSFNVSSTESNLKTFGSYVFEDCSQLKNYFINNSNFMSERGVMYSSDQTKLIFFPPASDLRYFALPYELSQISIGAFYKCQNLYEVLIPDNSIQIIGENAFAECHRLTFINIPKCVKNISSNAFKGCRSLSCGLLIEDIDSIRDQLIAAQLPYKCMSKCYITINNVEYLSHPKACVFIYLVFFAH